MLPNFRLWPVLHHLNSEQSLAICHLVTYSAKDLTGYGTAVYIDDDNSVFAAGVNSYTGKYRKSSEIIKGGGEFLERSVKVDTLSGLGITKIIRGSEFGAGLLVNGAIYFWGDAVSEIMLGDEFLVAFECFTPNTLCQQCESSLYSPFSIGGYSFNKCEACLGCPTYCEMANLPKTPVKTLVMFCDVFDILCAMCQKSCSCLRVGGYDMFYCEDCDLLQEPIGWCNMSSFPLRLQSLLQVKDVACGLSFILVFTASNEIYVWGDIGKLLQGFVSNPDNVVIEHVLCGSSHIVVMTDKGEVYTCGDGSSGQLGYEWNSQMGYTTLRKVPIPGAAVKICCGLLSTACLMADGSIVCFGSFKGSPFLTTIAQDTFTDVASATLTDFFTAKTASSVYFWRPKPTIELHLKVDAHHCFDALVGRSASYSRSSPEIAFMKFNPCVQHGLSHYAKFFNTNLHSDVIIKLKDGEQHAHRIVLYKTSAYYKNLFSNSTVDRVIDMTSQDPRAYRNLLKYFYQTLSVKLDWRELLSLHVLAINHGELEIVKDTFGKLLGKLNEKNKNEILY